MVRKAVFAAVLLSAASLFITLAPPLRFACALLQLFFLPGMAFTIFVLEGKLSRLDQIFISVLISPVLAAMMSFLVHMLTGDMETSVTAVIGASYLLFLLGFLKGKYEKVIESGGVPKMIFAVSICYAALILLSYLVNDYLLIRSDAWYHAAVIREVIARGIPPKEPLLADFSIKYMWFYHFFQSFWIKLSGLSLFGAMAFFNIINAFIFPYFAARFVSRFTARKSVIVFAVLLAIAGLDSPSWILWPVNFVRVFVGDVTGMAEVKRILANTRINGAEVIRFLHPVGTWQVNWNDKFLTLTVFNYSLNMFLVSLILFLKKGFLTESRIRAIITLFVITLGTFLFHTVTGMTLIFTMAGSAVLLFLAYRYVYGEKDASSRFYAPFLASMLAAIPAALYFFSLMAGENEAGGNSLLNNIFHIGGRNILTILFPLAILFFPARTAFRKIISAKDTASRILISWVICLLALCVFINIGIVGEKKFIYFLFLVIGPPIYVQIVEKIKSRTPFYRVFLTATVLVLFLVPAVLTFRGFMMEKPDSSMWSRRYDFTEEDKAFFDWVEKNIPPNAVIAENDNYHLCPVYASRRNLYSSYNVIRGLGYGGEKFDTYRAIQNSIFGKGGDPVKMARSMKRLGRELYIAVWSEDLKSNPDLERKLESEVFHEVYGSERVSLYALD